MSTPSQNGTGSTGGLLRSKWQGVLRTQVLPPRLSASNPIHDHAASIMKHRPIRADLAHCPAFVRHLLTAVRTSSSQDAVFCSECRVSVIPV